MRKLITFIVVSLIPVGMWTAGCRQDTRQASFPNSPEMKGLAQGPSANSNKPPRISPAPKNGEIDREILNLPDSPAMARATAVNDKSRQMAKQKPSDDLFGLPDTQSGLASVYDPQPADIGPARGGSEFWSRPSSGPAGARYSPAPAGVSAMAPADNDSGFAGPPVQFTPPPASRRNSGMNSGYPDPMEVPGIFMDEPLSMRSGGPPASRNSLSASFPGGDALGAPPPLTKREVATVSEKTGPARKSGQDGQGPVRLDLGGLVRTSSGRHSSSEAFSPLSEPAVASAYRAPLDSGFVSPTPPMIVRAIPGDYEPLPEPIPLEQYLATLSTEKPALPAPAAMPRRRGIQLPLPSPSSSQTLRVASVPVRDMPVEPVRPSSRKAPSTAAATSSRPSYKADGFLPLPELSALSRAAPVAGMEQEAPVSAAVSTSGQTAVGSSDIKKALAPLPDLSGTLAEKKSNSGKIDTKIATNIPASRPDPLTIPSLEQAGSRMDLSELAMAAGVATEAKKAPKKTEQKTSSEAKEVGKSSFEAALSGDLSLPELMSPPPARKKETKSADTATKSGSKSGNVEKSVEESFKEAFSSMELSGLKLPELSSGELTMPQMPTWVEPESKTVSSVSKTAGTTVLEKAGKTNGDAEAFADAFLEELKQEAVLQSEIQSSPVMSEVTPGQKTTDKEGVKTDSPDTPVTLASEPPRKVKLQPIRRHRDKEISKIDASMEVPPLRF